MSKLSMPQMARPGQGALIKRLHADQREAELAHQRITVRCAHCTKGNCGRVGRPFQFTGPVAEARARFADHRDSSHPELEPLAVMRERQKRSRRVTLTGKLGKTSSYHTRREVLSPSELYEREKLRRMVRSDLPPLDAEEVAT